VISSARMVWVTVRELLEHLVDVPLPVTYGKHLARWGLSWRN
jgi:hypothetical protein